MVSAVKGRIGIQLLEDWAQCAMLPVLDGHQSGIDIAMILGMPLMGCPTSGSLDEFIARLWVNGVMVFDKWDVCCQESVPSANSFSSMAELPLFR